MLLEYGLQLEHFSDSKIKLTLEKKLVENRKSKKKEERLVRFENVSV